MRGKVMVLPIDASVVERATFSNKYPEPEILEIIFEILQSIQRSE